MKLRNNIKNKFPLFYGLSICTQFYVFLMILFLLTLKVTFLTPFLSLSLTRKCIEVLEDKNVYQLFISIFIYLLGFVFCHVITLATHNQILLRASIIQNKLKEKLNEDRMTLPYEKMFEKDFTLLLSKMRQLSNSPLPCFFVFYEVCISLCVAIIGLILYSTKLVEINIFILIIIFLSAIFSCLINLIYIRKTKGVEKLVFPIQRKIAYLLTRTDDLSCGKDIRLFGMFDWLHSKCVGLINEEQAIETRQSRILFYSQLINLLISLLRDVCIYTWLIYVFVNSDLSIADFIYFLGLTSLISAQLIGITSKLQKHYQSYLNLKDYLAYSDFTKRNENNNYIELPEKINSITFQNVSYRYPNSQNYILKDVSFQIQENERVGLVGVNGAGKTTLISLICGLLTPCEGIILINGISTDQFDPVKYPGIFSAVSQTINILPASVADNIQLDLKNEERMRTSMSMAGMDDILPNTMLIKEIHPDARRLSGGELQKLAFARAIHKEASVLILDEPTAALDSISESQLYQSYHQVIRDKIGIFISHRLASTQFCDRIMLLENGKIVEEGTHNELLQKGGRYKEMFEVQRKYYLKTEKGKECL